MKKILVLLLFSFGLQAQTSYKDVDISAAAGNDYETLLTNVEYGLNHTDMENFFNDIGYSSSGFKFSKRTENSVSYRFEKQIISGKEKQSFVYVKLASKKIPQYTLPMITKVEIYGDVQSIIKFYINYWSTDLNFNDVKVGEVVSTRFLSDVATLSFPDANTAKITVVTAKDRI
ncbi:hypothetical protein [Flavobacterium algoritolerans]|uniref:Uncharacterized protein n=1 Tax=Flavobacterium algoritolerans TaxID=3041254 RepID=A0ABT6V831_9FLAO|nr:hypothetical protein [Flavobacterium algoritolerans]MDI5894383.1 hypothetical protein [Flavobacterium algoritolerans]